MAGVLITVHGTAAASQADVGEKWWQEGSTFVNEAVKALEASGAKRVEVLPFHWSGANLQEDREEASERLTELIKTHTTDKDDIHIVAHSHGGNVVLDAFADSRKSWRVKSIASVGAPFLLTDTTKYLGRNIGATISDVSGEGKRYGLVMGLLLILAYLLPFIGFELISDGAYVPGG